MLRDESDEALLGRYRGGETRAFEVLPPVTLDAGVVRGPQSGINDEGYPRWLEQGALLRALNYVGTFCDVGTPERLLEANLAVLAGVWSGAHLLRFAGLEERPGGCRLARGARAGERTLTGLPRRRRRSARRRYFVAVVGKGYA